MEYTGGNDTSIYEGKVTKLKGNGDFRDEECINILKETDIVCTNPPFSLFREYLAQLIEYNKQFIIIAPLNALKYKEIFPLFMANKIWTGYTLRGTGTHWFGVPLTYNKGKTKVVDGVKYATIGSAMWFTNLDIIKRHEPLDLIEKYSPEKYPKYDNYDAINVNRIYDIPYDYDGVMGVPITFMDKYCPEQFEIIGLDRYTIPKEKLVAGSSSLNGKPIYTRIYIKKR